jgi:hypothetical protein
MTSTFRRPLESSTAGSICFLDRSLLGIRVSSLYNFHSIKKRGGDRIQLVGGADKQDVRQVDASPG